MGQTKSTLSEHEVEELRVVSKFTKKELRRLHQRFLEVDTDGIGRIELDEIIRIPELAVNPLNKRILDAFRRENDRSEISFKDFIAYLSVFAPRADAETKTKFLFQLYDINRNSQISTDELVETMQLIVGSNLTESQLKDVVEKTFQEADLDRDGFLNYDEFRKVLINEDVTGKVTIYF